MSKRKRHTRQPEVKLNQTSSPYTLDIVIPVFQRFDLLGECLRSIPAATDNYMYRIIIVDNGSPKEVADSFYANLNDPAIKIIRNKENMGFPRACNQGFDRGHSPYVMFLNDDVILHPNSIHYMIEEMDSDPKLGIVGMKLIFPEQTDLPQNDQQRPAGKIQHVGLATNIRAEVYHQFIGWSPDNPKVLAVRDAYAVTGAAMMTRRSIFSKANKFFEGYGGGSYEDVDFCLTVRQMGYNIIVCQKSVGIHHTGATAQTYNIGFPLNENKMIFMQRWQKLLDWSEWVNA